MQQINNLNHKNKKKIAILWHMHQPFYANPYASQTELPWVRLHGLKDYYGMAAILKEFPEIKTTFNLVPSLLVQLQNYLNGERDIFQDLFIKNAQDLNPLEIHFIIRHFFSANHENLIEPYPRYFELLKKKHQFNDEPNPAWEHIFTTDEIRDIQVWFQLCYIDEEYKENDNRIISLLNKGKNFTEEDKQILEAVEMEILGKIIPLYKQLSDAGQIEISTTPFYHPILPLLINPQKGRIANPCLPFYDLNFDWKDDAVYQLESALDYMTLTMGKRPVGIWPSEGSLSMKVLDIMQCLGVEWTATDEINLANSLGIRIERNEHFDIKNPEILYKPYEVKGNSVKLLFRDRHISDLIGFPYHKRSQIRAAEDLIERIKRVPVTPGHDCVIPIILDGENPWEHYEKSGREFLREFFKRIIEDPVLEMVTFSEAVQAEPGSLEHLSPGSWIRGNFDIWIGHEEDRKAWKLLEDAKNASIENKDRLTPAQMVEIKRYISIAQGSDWYWWYGKEHFTPDLDIFDNLFRKNLQKVYDIIGIQAPEALSYPIPCRVDLETKCENGIVFPTKHITPCLDGSVDSYYEWLEAGRIDISAFGGAMNIVNPIVKTIHFGFSDSHLFLRIDTTINAREFFEKGYSMEIVLKHGQNQKNYHIAYPKTTVNSPNKLEKDTPLPEVAIGAVAEVGIHFDDIGLSQSSTFQIKFEWKFNGDYFLAIPLHDFFHLSVPSQKEYSSTWLV